MEIIIEDAKYETSAAASGSCGSCDHCSGACGDSCRGNCN